MKQVNVKKLVLLNLPYFLLGLFATNLGEAWRLATGADASAKILHGRHIVIKFRHIRQISNILICFSLSKINWLITHKDFSLIGLQKPQDHFHCCCFSCAVLPNEAKNATLWNRHIQIFYNLLLPETFR